MQRREFLKAAAIIGTAGMIAPHDVLPTLGEAKAGIVRTEDDRAYWVKTLVRIAEPVLKNMSQGTLKRNMPVERAHGYGLKAEKVTYLEAFGRTVSGIAPWLALPDDHSDEGKIRKQFRDYTLLSMVNAVDPTSADYLNFREEAQPLVDAAYLCQAFLRAPQALWEPLDKKTKANLIKELKELRRIRPAYNNWLLFAAMVEVFLLYVKEEWEPLRTEVAIKKMQEWYVGDGWYGDGPHFALDYYNGYVIHPMLADLLKVLTHKNKWPREDYDQALKRMQRFAILQERLIAPDGTYPPVGRSMTYRLAAFQPLVQLALHHQLPEELKPGQVRSAITSVMKNLFEMEGTFDKLGWLQLGICGHQPEAADVYTSTGSLYICTNGFLSLGLSAEDKFWTDPATEWTAKKVWSGKPVKKDYKVDY